MIPKSKLMSLRVLPTHFAVAVIACLLGVVVSWSWKSLRHPRVVNVEIEEPVVKSVEIVSDAFPQTPTTTIVSQMHACGPKANFHAYNLSDGTAISQACREMTSVSRARHELQKMLRHAQILERRPSLDERRRVVGELIIAQAEHVISIEINRSSICSTEASSLKQLQWFEHR
jgi:hypothetical protein